MSRTTREQLLLQAQAIRLLRGFYGVSIASVADELKLTNKRCCITLVTKKNSTVKCCNEYPTISNQS